jgi:hypothetical protein
MARRSWVTPSREGLAEYMVHGTEHQRARRLGLLLNVPLTLEQAAAVLDIRRRSARQISRNARVSKADGLAERRATQWLQIQGYPSDVGDTGSAFASAMDTFIATVEGINKL